MTTTGADTAIYLRQHAQTIRTEFTDPDPDNNEDCQSPRTVEGSIMWLRFAELRR